MMQPAALNAPANPDTVILGKTVGLGAALELANKTLACPATFFPHTQSASILVSENKQNLCHLDYTHVSFMCVNNQCTMHYSQISV